jgi:hypothetical protein
LEKPVAQLLAAAVAATSEEADLPRAFKPAVVRVNGRLQGLLLVQLPVLMAPRCRPAVE